MTSYEPGQYVQFYPGGLPNIGILYVGLILAIEYGNYRIQYSLRNTDLVPPACIIGLSLSQTFGPVPGSVIQGQDLI